MWQIFRIFFRSQYVIFFYHTKCKRFKIFCQNDHWLTWHSAFHTGIQKADSYTNATCCFWILNKDVSMANLTTHLRWTEKIMTFSQRTWIIFNHCIYPAIESLNFFYLHVSNKLEISSWMLREIQEIIDFTQLLHWQYLV